MLELYHYTSVESREKIRREGVIRRTVTSDRDAMFGEGVYLNKMNPEEFEKDEIAKNNWGQYGFRKSLEDGKADAYVKIVIPVNDRKLMNHSTGNRSIFRYRGDLWLDQYDHDFGKNSEWGAGVVIAAGIGFGALAVGGLALLGSYLSMYKCDKCDRRFKDNHSMECHKMLSRN